MSGVSNVVIRIGAETAAAVSSINKVDKALGDTQTTGQKLQGGIEKAAVPAAAALTVLGAVAIKSAKAAAEDAASKEKLDSQIRRSTGATEAAITANEAYIDSMVKQTATADDELRPAMSQLVRATGDVHQAQKLLALSTDLAAATGKPLATVTAAVSKGYAGNAASLKKLVPSLDDAAIKSKDWAAIQEQLNGEVGGAAARSAETAAGQYKQMSLQMDEATEAIGAGLLPIIQTALPFVTKFAEAAGGHAGAITATGAAVAALAAAVLIINGAIKVYNAIMVVWRARTIAVTVAQWLLNAAITANPIGLIIVAIAALAAGLVIAYRHSATFRNIVQTAFKVAKENAILLLGPIGLIIKAFQILMQRSGTVREAVKKAMEVIHAAIELVLDAVNALKDAIGGIHFPSKPDWVPFSMPTATGASTRTAGAGGPVVNVTISGAIDPENTALAIRRVLERYDRRRGRRPLGGPGA